MREASSERANTIGGVTQGLEEEQKWAWGWCRNNWKAMGGLGVLTSWARYVSHEEDFGKTPKQEVSG